MANRRTAEHAAVSLRRSLSIATLCLTQASIAACSQTPESVPAEKANPAPVAQSLSIPLEEFGGEFYADLDELAAAPTNDIARSMRLNVTAMAMGQDVYNKNCASCHGPDLKGIPGSSTPDLTDANWRFAGDDLASGGGVKIPSDVEWTVRYGIRSGHKKARGLEADMVAFDPQFRTKEDTQELGSQRFLSDDEIADVVEYVLQISGQNADAAKAARGNTLFHDGTKGNCNDCHGDDGHGELTIGSTNLTQKDLYLYGSDRASIVESINKGRHGVMPAFDGKLSAAEIKAVSVFVFSRAAKP
jgi:cbb3-type cytochrome c oxidase subunit III